MARINNGFREYKTPNPIEFYSQLGRSTEVLGNLYIQLGRSTEALGNIKVPPLLNLTLNLENQQWF